MARNRAQSTAWSYVPDEASALQQWVEARDAELGQALRFILSSRARINEGLHLRADKVSFVEKKVELLRKGSNVDDVNRWIGQQFV